jgi:HD-GYP domain-containing protein (c-di-GMP phosphodiesterase class II)
MKTRVIVYVWVVVALAIAATSLLYSVNSEIAPGLLVGPALMAAVSFVGGRLAYSQKNSQLGDVSFVPDLTALLLYPSWVSVVLVASSTFFSRALGKQPAIKLIFNTAQTLLSGSLTCLVYLGLGGESLQIDSGFSLLPLGVAVIGYLLVNSLSVAAVVSLSESSNIIRTWTEANLSGLIYDVIAIPFVYGFARAYVDWGPWGAGALLTLIVGLRTTYHSKYRLETTNHELLELFVQTVEFRDPYTSGHSRRVKRSSLIIASSLGLPLKEQERIGTAALLHDVGKIHQVFGPILSKTGRLTPEERAVMELHPIKSAELVAQISDLRDLVPAVRHHHERWDGAGYPDQLAGENIPLAARIITIADTIDAMVTDRPYRKALGEAEVREELARHSGTQFDPAICKMLLESPDFARLFDPADSGQPIRLTGMFSAVRKRVRTPAAA